MKVDEELINKVAKNARLILTPEEAGRLKQDFHDILENFSKLNDINTENTELSILPVKIPTVIREDKEEESLSNEDALKNANHKKAPFFKGPRIL